MALRAVKSIKKEVDQGKATVAAAAATGDQLQLLRAMRERIAAAITSDGCPPRDLASLSRRLQDIAKEIKTLETAAEQESAENDSPDEDFDPETL